MITLIYHIKPEDREIELDWLRSQKIFPAITESWDWTTNLMVLKIGAIVSPEAALNIKLRHKLDAQKQYKQR